MVDAVICKVGEIRIKASNFRPLSYIYIKKKKKKKKKRLKQEA